MYTIRKESLGRYILCTIQNEDTGEYFSFFPEYGASVNQLALQGKDGMLRTLLYESRSENQIRAEGISMYKGAKLFPFPNRINGGAYMWQGKQYQLPINEIQEGHAHHGLVYRSCFNLVEERASGDEGAVAVEYLYDKETEGYPFKIRLRIVFALNAQGFSCRTIVTNEDQVPIPFADGWHPYFQLDASIEHTSLCFSPLEEMEVNEKMIPTGKTRHTTSFASPKTFGSEHFDTCFRLHKEPGQQLFQAELRDEKQAGKLRLWLKPPYSYLHVYTPPARNCVALEPMTSPADVFNNQMDLLVLAPGEKKELEWGLQLSS